jgi:hypothetical protein
MEEFPDPDHLPTIDDFMRATNREFDITNATAQIQVPGGRAPVARMMAPQQMEQAENAENFDPVTGEIVATASTMTPGARQRRAGTSIALDGSRTFFPMPFAPPHQSPYSLLDGPIPLSSYRIEDPTETARRSMEDRRRMDAEREAAQLRVMEWELEDDRRQAIRHRELDLRNLVRVHQHTAAAIQRSLEIPDRMHNHIMVAPSRGLSGRSLLGRSIGNPTRDSLFLTDGSNFFRGGVDESLRGSARIQARLDRAEEQFNRVLESVGVEGQSAWGQIRRGRGDGGWVAMANVESRINARRRHNRLIRTWGFDQVSFDQAIRMEISELSERSLEEIEQNLNGVDRFEEMRASLGVLSVGRYLNGGEFVDTSEML